MAQFRRRPFGNPDELQSCRVGEFGGFAAWAQLQYQARYGMAADMHDSVDAYFGWMFNRSREDNPRFNTLAFAPKGGRTTRPTTFIRKFVTPNEAWFIRQLADAARPWRGAD